MADIDFEPEIDFEEEPSKPINFEPEDVAFEPEPELEASVVYKPAATPEELTQQNFQARGGVPVQHSSFWQNANEPLLHIATPVAGDTVQKATGLGKTASGVIGGVQSAVANTVNSLTSPLGIATLGVGTLPKLAQKIVAGLFATHMATQVPRQGKALVDAINEGDPEKTARAATELGLTGTFIGVAGKHALKKEAAPTGPTQQPVFEPLPDLPDKAVSADLFSEAYGAGRIPVLGRLIDPNAAALTAEQKSISSYHAEKAGVGPSVASYIGSRFGPEIQSAFRANEQGDMNVGARSPDQSLKMSDVFEGLERNPNAYILSPEQQNVWNNALKPILDSKRRLIDKYDLQDTVDIDGNPIPHFHRIVTKFPTEQPQKTGTGQSIGARIPSQRSRVFTKSEKQGWEKGYQYELDPVKRLVTDIERTYKAIADKRLVDDPVFGGTTKAHLETQLRTAFAPELASGEMTERGFQAMLENQAARGRVFQPGFSGKIFEPETAKLLNDIMQPGDSRLRRAIATANDATKALRLGFDVGVGQLQLLPTFFRNPAIWAEANWKSVKAMTNPEVFTDFVKNHEAAVRELAENGSSVGQLQEYMSGLRPGSVVSEAPLIGPVAKGFGRQFQTALDVAKVQLWEAWRKPDMTPQEKMATIRAIESQLGIGRMESIGVKPRHALIERATLLASSYYRGAINYVATVAERGTSGKVARQGLTAFVGGGLAMFYGVGKLVGMSDEEIRKRLDPSRSDFMQWTIENDEGKAIHVGIGGIHRSLIRLAGNTIRTSIEHPENWASLSPEKNPIARWLRGHMAAVPEMAFTAFSGEDYFGNEADIKTVAASALPLTLQQGIRKEGEPAATQAEYAASFAGLSARPESQYQRKQRITGETAQTKFEKPYEDLTVPEQASVQRAVNKDERAGPSEPAAERVRELAMKAAFDREQRVRDGLSKANQKKLEALQVSIGGYDPEVSFGGVRFPMTDKQREKYEAVLIAEYNKILDRVDEKGWSNMKPAQRQALLNARKEIARNKARAAIRK